FFVVAELLEQILRHIIVIIDNTAKMPSVLRVIYIKTFLYKISMPVVTRENYRLADIIAPLYLKSVVHQMIQDKIHRRFVKHERIDLRRTDLEILQFFVSCFGEPQFFFQLFFILRT